MLNYLMTTNIWGREGEREEAEERDQRRDQEGEELLDSR